MIDHYFDEPLLRTSISEVSLILNVLLPETKPLKVDDEIGRGTHSIEEERGQ